MRRSDNVQDDFQVKDQNGQTVVKCTGKAFSFKDRKGRHTT